MKHVLQSGGSGRIGIILAVLDRDRHAGLAHPDPDPFHPAVMQSYTFFKKISISIQNIEIYDI
jgi:hypothetical protein